MKIDRDALLDGLVEASIAAGTAIMTIYDSHFSVTVKPDSSPVTDADAAGEAIILQALATLSPEVPVVAEEEAAAGRIPDTDGHFYLVDPLDGTKEFISRNGDFTVNIALIEDHAPGLGVVFAPVERRIFAGDAKRLLAWTALVGEDGIIGSRRTMRVRDVPDEGLAAVASRSHNSAATESYLDQFKVASRVTRGSSLKICMVACGQADLYPRLAPTMEWDIAAGDAVLRAAGGMISAPDGGAMPYGKPGFFNRGFVAAGGMKAPPIQAFMRDAPAR
ncbi:3'(2'),5'-bisphosphate nucleotidase CysQ [Sphingomonas sp.]|uniref:3'(2'),5'-bisphosphate nucleotidase CysQ n=1 Tax=Sphingomonas sp. TaxID=28214 RepID=UPI003B3B371A